MEKAKNIIFFERPDEFRKWLSKNHTKETELLVGFFKKASKKPSMTWSESVDQALCFGWIDGVTKSIDSERYCIRFTPRKPGSIWSVININKVAQLEKAGLMKPAGQRAFALRTEAKSGIYSHEKETVELAPEYLKSFRKNKIAWKYFSTPGSFLSKSNDPLDNECKAGKDQTCKA